MPESFRFLKESELIHRPPDVPEEFDLAIALDTASQQRLGVTLHAIRRAGQWINIDHHVSNPGYGDLVYIDTGAPATGQIVYEFLRTENLPLIPAAADALYAAISTDTGSFRYANVTARTFEIAAELLKSGIDAAAIANHLYESYPKRRVQLLGEILPQAMFDSDDKVASLTLTDTISIGLLPLLQLVLAVLVIVGLQFLLYRTAIGRAFRAVSDDPRIAQLMGLNNRHVFGLAMALSCAIVALAGVLLAIRANFDPATGPTRLIFGFEAVIIGGLTSFWGTLAGGIILGIVQSLASYFDPGWQILAGHIAFLVVLAVRPNGLFGGTARS